MMGMLEKIRHSKRQIRKGCLSRSLGNSLANSYYLARMYVKHHLSTGNVEVEYSYTHTHTHAHTHTHTHTHTQNTYQE